MGVSVPVVLWNPPWGRWAGISVPPLFTRANYCAVRCSNTERWGTLRGRLLGWAQCRAAPGPSPAQRARGRAAVSMSTKGRKYSKRVSFSEDEDEQCWKEENGGVDAHNVKSMMTVRDSSGYYRHNMWVFAWIQLIAEPVKLTIMPLSSLC